MKKLMLSLAMAMLFTITSLAQTTADPNNSQGTQESSPAMQSSQSGATANTGTAANAAEKRLSGCVAQENGQYVLETRHGKTVPLSGQDVSAQVGHTVAVRGTWTANAMGSTASSDQTSATASTTTARSFDVANVRTISDTCKMGNSTNSSGAGMGTGNQQPQ
jgi:hypothetical protein